MSGLEGRILTLIKELEEEKRLADKRAKQLLNKIDYYLDQVVKQASSPTFAGVDLGTKAIQTTSKARAFLSADQLNIPDTTKTKVLLDAETYDPGGNFDADGVDSEFVSPISAYYLIYGQIQWYASVADKLYRAHIFINGVEISSTIVQAAVAGLLTVPITDILYVPLGETIDLRGYHNAGAATPDVKGHASGRTTYLDIHILSI